MATVDHGNSVVRETVQDKLFEDVETEYSKMLQAKEEGEGGTEEEGGEVVEATADTDDSAEAEQPEAVEAEEEAESREARRTKAEAYKRGQRKPVEAEEATEETPRDEQGRFVSKQEAEVTEEAGEEVSATEVKEEKPFLTQFVLKQGTQETEIPRDVTLDFTANKKEYKDVPLDKVVLWAQMGVYNEAREQEVQNAKHYVAEVTNLNKQQEQALNTLRKEFDDLLGDEAYYEAARSEWLRHNTPEQRARRAEENLRQERQREAATEQTRQAQAYIQNEIFPAVEKVLQTFKGQVSEDEVMGRFNRLIMPYMQNGSVPYQLLPTVKQLVETELAGWAQGITMERDTARKKQETAVKEVAGKQVKTAQTRATLAKRELARAVKPQGTQRVMKEAKKPKQYKSAQEWSESALEEILGG